MWGMDKVMPLRQTRDSLGKRVEAAHFADENTVITEYGEPRAVLVSYEWYQQLRGATNQDHGAGVGQTSTDSHSEQRRQGETSTPSDQA